MTCRCRHARRLAPIASAGVSLASGVQVSSLSSWAQLASVDSLWKLAPALAMVACIIVVMHRCRRALRGLPCACWPLAPAVLEQSAGALRRSPLALPALLLAVPALFYVALFAAGLSLEDARQAGWVSKPQPGDGEWQFWRAWSLYRIRDFPPSNIYWRALPGQVCGA